MHILRSLGPAVASASPREAIRAGFGAFIGLGLAGALLLLPFADKSLGFYLVAPFGASAVLLFAVPNSPLAQPWSAIVGNTVAAVVSVAVCLTVADPTLRVALAVGLAIVATILCRAVHPPSGAVAMTAAMSPEAIEALGFWFALAPVAAGTTFIVALATIYARLTGRHYPIRQFDDPSKQGTLDRNPVERLGLSEEELTELLGRYRQSFNLGVEDFARLLGAAELQAATHSSDAMTAQDIMSRDLITVRENSTLSEVAELFKHHRFASLPVTGPDAKYLGIIFQIHLIRQAREDALRLERGFRAAFKRLLDSNWDRPIRAGEIMDVAGPRATPQTPIGSLVLMMVDSEVDAVPVLDGDRVTGIVTRTDMFAAMARSFVRHGD
ncbi:HPP family protein [Celeribacter sp.]|uniref:HPP family protein n=1 Tax=Celeribacter sp. TaxID=1890673 RepID=UPI003A8DED4A